MQCNVQLHPVISSHSFACLKPKPFVIQLNLAGGKPNHRASRVIQNHRSMSAWAIQCPTYYSPRTLSPQNVKRIKSER